MELQCLNDKNIYPDDEPLSLHLGNAKKAWDSFMDLLRTDYPLLSPEWRYYNDGKRWLCKTTKKTKTICWISVWKRFFRVTFYFGNKAEETIKNSVLDEKLKARFLNYDGKLKIRPITIFVKKKSDLKILRTLIELKEKTK
jgi:Protein of unknown function (DUF3788)